MGIPHDENLPEVAPGNDPQTMPDSSPQALTAQEAHAHQQFFEGGAKFPDASLDSAKFTTAPPDGFESGFYHENSRSQDQQSSPPWNSPAPSSAVTGLRAGSVPIGSSQFGSEEEKGASERGERICGLKKRIFYMALAACIIIVSIVVGVGVGVGVSLGSQQAKASGQPSAPDGGSSDSSPAGTSSPPPPLAQPTNKVPPTKLNETRLNGPFKFQGWSGKNFTGESTEVVRGVGITQFAFDIRSYVWDPDGFTCCVSFCNETVSEHGYYRCQVLSQPQPVGPFNRIVTLCGGLEVTNQAASCS
ncbi:hypothetical protein GGTG_08619 [Gaeumannomyces tritici R3-111a-1]|uniref:Uncharacterized protein n=1 Tax=Gaeumannomyces tritici (strain R3-111a-1) TaxID=644352 RepID=J3P533_GAET3|nr:hypothetical protein GGTG_08619 [Gaeumannomyces tritici R3-111a-1]EJT74781.1 hypothetical protein GGTG_08619 [Gaeumannomyces tritici R3-111a-1]